MEPSEYLAALARDGAAFAESIRQAGLDAPVRSCPEWTVADLVWHLAEVHYFWGSIVAARASSWDQVVELERVPDDQLLATYDHNLTALLDALTTTDPSTEVWTWSSQHDVAFILRRMAQETAVHRCDADQTAGKPIQVEANLASDGIDEFLFHFLPRARQDAAPVGGSVHIHCGDVPGEWTIRPAGDGYNVTREHAKGDCALRGPASDLLLALWRRDGAGSIDVVGDQDVANRFLAATQLE